MTEFCPNAKATILAIAGKIDHLHIICTKQFFYKILVPNLFWLST